MGRLIVVCHAEDCPVSKVNRPLDPVPMTCTGETQSAWLFKCESCHNFRAASKDQVGGTFGVGKRDDGTGPTTGKGPLKYRPGGIVGR